MRIWPLITILTLALLAGCPKSETTTTTDSTMGAGGSTSTADSTADGTADSGGIDAAASGSLTGSINIDGSSTVYPVTEAVAEKFRNVEPNVQVTVGISGTGGGFKKFGAGETDISDASRPIKASEAEACAASGVQFLELPVAYDGLSVVVHPENDFVDHLTVEELKKIWEPGSTITNWKDVRAGFPDMQLKLYGPGTDSGTFDYFTEAICGEGGASRSDYTASEDDNTIVQGVSGDKGSLGYFGFAYYLENQDSLKIVPVDGGSGPITPSEQTINDGSYAPLSRPIFIYLSSKAIDRPEVQSFINFYLEEVPDLAGDVGYVQLPADVYALATENFNNRVYGTGYGEGGKKVLEALQSVK